ATDAHVTNDNLGTDVKLSMVGSVLLGLEALGVEGLPASDLADGLTDNIEVFDVARALKTAPSLAGGILPTGLGPTADVLPVVSDLTTVASDLADDLTDLPGADVLPVVGDLTSLPALGALEDAELPAVGKLKLAGLTDRLSDLDLGDLPADLLNVRLGDLADVLEDLDIDLDEPPSVLKNVKLSQLPAVLDGLELSKVTSLLSDLDLDDLPADLLNVRLGALTEALEDLDIDLDELPSVLQDLDLDELPSVL